MLQPSATKPAPVTKPRKERSRVERAERVQPNPEAASTAAQVPPAPAPAPHVPAAPQEVRVLQPPASKLEETTASPRGQPAPHASTTPSPPVAQAAPGPQVIRPAAQRSGPVRPASMDRPASTPPELLNPQKSDPGPSRGSDTSRNRGAPQGAQRQGNDAPSFSGASRAESVSSEPSRPMRGTASLPEQPPSWSGRGDSRGGRGGRGNRGRMPQGMRPVVQGNYVPPQVYYPPGNLGWYPQGYPPQMVPLAQAQYAQQLDEALRAQIEYYFSVQNLVKVCLLRRYFPCCKCPNCLHLCSCWYVCVQTLAP